MTRAQKAARIQEILDALLPQPAIPLDHVDPFTLLVAVLLSAQTTDVQVNKVTPGLFAIASTPQAMAALPESEILQAIRTCGLAPTKARNLKQMAQILVERHAGVVPRDFDSLEALPGVGHKTASVVMVQAFGVPAFPVDTHIHRLARRWGLSAGGTVVQTEHDLQKLFPRPRWGAIHLQIIMFGRLYCPARNHDFDACPICSWAAAPAARAAERSAARARARRRGNEA